MLAEVVPLLVVKTAGNDFTRRNTSPQKRTVIHRAEAYAQAVALTGYFQEASFGSQLTHSCFRQFAHRQQHPAQDGLGKSP